MERRDYLGKSVACECGRSHFVSTLQITIGPNGLTQLPQLLHDLYLDGGGMLVADATTWKIAGQRIVREIVPTLAAHVVASPRPHADRATAEGVLAAVREAEFLVSCGAGTVTDLTKYAAHHLGIPFVAVATAPSMNGYTSGIVALTEGGLKKTIPATPAIAMLADLDLLCAAPLDMIRAGLGDLISKPVCNADWKLAHLMRGEHFCDRPFAMISDLEAIYLPQAGGIPARDPGVIAALIESIAFSGISMVLAGSSAPASGGEHLISHTLDMQQGLAGNPLLDFHGTQVGVATLASLALYDFFLATPRDAVDWDHALTTWQPLEAMAPQITQDWGVAANEVLAAFGKKHPATQDIHHQEIETLRDRWTDLQAAVAPFLANAAMIRTGLTAAGAKTSHADLGLSHERWRATLLGARIIRNRYTLLDLLASVGLLESAVDASL